MKKSEQSFKNLEKALNSLIKAVATPPDTNDQKLAQTLCKKIQGAYVEIFEKTFEKIKKII